MRDTIRSAKEMEKRVIKINDLKDRMEKLHMEVKVKMYGNSSSRNGSLNTTMNLQKGEDGEYDDTRGLDNRTVLE